MNTTCTSTMNREDRIAIIRPRFTRELCFVRASLERSTISARTVKAGTRITEDSVITRIMESIESFAFRLFRLSFFPPLLSSVNYRL